MRKQDQAASLLLLATLVSGLAAWKLSVGGSLPGQSTPYFLAFAVSGFLAFAAGSLSGRLTREAPVEGLVAPGRPRRRTFRVVAAVVAAACLVWTWILQGPNSPRYVLLLWAVAMVATVLSFPVNENRLRRSALESTHPTLKGAILIVLLVAAFARLVELDRIPPVFGGDEANQAMDGIGWIRESSREDPFGTGWYGTMRIGMLPAGVGALLFDSPIAGPRAPYAVAGTLSVAAAAVAAGQLAGGWAALGSAALLAFCPHHVHFSRLASVMILDALFAAVAVVLLLAVRRSSSPRTAALAGVVAGISLYGYSGGRAIALTFLLTAPLLAFKARVNRGRKRLLLVALLVGFSVAAGPNLRFAARHFAEWNGRFSSVNLFARHHWEGQVQLLGSPAAVLANQLRRGTLGVLAERAPNVWFTGRPVIGPFVLPALGIVGLGYLLGQRRFAAAAIVGLIAAGNFAGLILTDGAPAAQRASSLAPMLAILGGVALSGFFELLPAETISRLVAGTALVGAWLAYAVTRYPLDWEQYAEYGGVGAAFCQSASALLVQPRYRAEKVLLHGLPVIHSSFPSFPYFLEGRPLIDVADSGVPHGADSPLPVGLHVFSWDKVAAGSELAERHGIRHGVYLAHPGKPREHVGYVFLVRD